MSVGGNNNDDAREENVCYSGGAKGADLTFGLWAARNQHAVVHYTFEGKGGYKGEHARVLTQEQLAEAKEAVKEAGLSLGRNVPRDPVVKNLINRNYYQVKDAERVYAVTRWNLAKDDDHGSTVEGELGGGTGWAVQMAIQRRCPEIYLYALERAQWYAWSQDSGCNWKRVESVPRPHGRYAGIGSRELGEGGDPKFGEKIIEMLYKIV